MAEYTIGLDLGGTNLRAAAIDKQGHMIQKVAGRTNYSEGRDAIVEDMVASIRVLREKLGPHDLAGIGIGAPGFIRLEDGVIANINNLPQLEGFPLRDRLESELGAKVILENDANAAALGEQWMGAGRDVQDLILLTLGTGIGGGIIYQGKIMHGAQGMAGEFGHITVVPNGNPCGCGNHGCAEKHASARAIAAMAGLVGLGDITSEECYALALAGNKKAQMVFTSMGQTLGILLALLINTFNFPLYLLSGGVLAGWDQFAPSMMDEVRRRSFAYRSSLPRIEKGALGNEAGLYGAAYLPWMGPR